MFDECVLRGRRLAPARFCAPLAGYTHSAFRRLLFELGGCGAVWTEMLAASQTLSENFERSPWLRRRPTDGYVVFQLMLTPRDSVERIFQRLAGQGVEAVDLNLACDAWTIRTRAAGSGLFEDLEAMRRTVTAARRHWPGLLTAKLRLGSEGPGWETRFADRLRVLEEAGVDAIILHPRFFEDKFKRRARLELLPWAATVTRLPLIANGDLDSPARVAAQAGPLGSACAIMIGRMAIVRPWLFAAWDRPITVSLPDIWRRLYDYILEDFPPPVALRRVRMFTKYFAANFTFGHQFQVSVANAPTLDVARGRAEDFFSRAPTTLRRPSPGSY